MFIVDAVVDDRDNDPSAGVSQLPGTAHAHVELCHPILRIHIFYSYRSIFIFCILEELVFLHIDPLRFQLSYVFTSFVQKLLF